VVLDLEEKKEVALSVGNSMRIVPRVNGKLLALLPHCKELTPLGKMGRMFLDRKPALIADYRNNPAIRSAAIVPVVHHCS
jgi:hypothetical protein